MGVLNLLAALLLVGANYQDRVPEDWVSKVPKEAQQKAKEQMAKLPKDKQLWGYVINAGLAGIVYLCVGIWTQSAASAFQEIVDTAGRDISHLMNAITSLKKMYTLCYTLLMIALIAILIGIGFAVYTQYFA